VFKTESRNTEIANVKLDADSSFSTIGWLRIQGTNIDYPIIRSDDVDAEFPVQLESYVWSLNLDEHYHNRIRISGHNIFNLSSQPKLSSNYFKRFEELMNFVYYDFAKENQFVQLTYDGEDHLYRVYSVSFLNPLRDSGDLTASKEETAEYIEKALKNSIYKYDIDVNSDDNIISLITCTRFFGISSDMTSFRIDAREVRKDEKRVNSRVTKNSNYDIIEEIIGGNDE
jgi:hypothetical protein